MKKMSLKQRIWFGFGGILALLMLVALHGAAPAAAANTVWTARYWDNRSLTGDPVVVREEADLNHDWGGGAPHTLVGDDDFSARWTRTLNVPAGSYRFTATLDDGMRVWVDNVLIIDSWMDSQVRSLSSDVYLTSGDHQLKVEYYEAGGQAVAKLSWTQVGGQAPLPIANWKGEYFNNVSLSGNPAVTRDDARIDFNWGGGAPASGVAADQFSVRWTRTLTLEGGRYRFTVQADDGARLWVNNRLIINEWHDASAGTYIAEIDLPGGAIPVQFEYYENQGGAFVLLAYDRISGGGSGWTGAYYNNRTLSGTPALTRADAAINFNWGTGSPATGINSDDFSVRWTRSQNFTAGRYRFSVSSDDGARLWVNGRLLIDAWYDHEAQAFTGEIDLPGGSVPLQLEYYEHGGGARVQLTWTAVSTQPPSTPQPPTSGAGGTGTVVSSRLNVRTGPGLQYNILGQLVLGQSVGLTGYRSADANWVTITFNGAQAWISAKPAYLQTAANVSTFPVWQGNVGGPTPAGSTGRVTAAYYLNVRSAPAVADNVVTVIPNGTIVELLGRNAATTWLRIRLTNGTVGWVSASFISSTTALSTLPVAN